MSLLKDLWSRLRDFLPACSGRSRRSQGGSSPAPSFRGAAFSPQRRCIAPQREYLAYVPASATRPWNFRRHPLLVLIHGCKQTPEEIAAATRIARLADDDDLLVLLPRQNPRANVWGCWNWFDAATTRGWGETAIVAAQIRAVRRNYRIDKQARVRRGPVVRRRARGSGGPAAPRSGRRRVRPFRRRVRRRVVADGGAAAF